VKAAAFDYVAPGTVEAAIQSASATGGKFIAGGQSLAPMLNLRLVTPSMLIALQGVAGLAAVRDHGAYCAIGAGATHASIEDGMHAIEDRGLLRAVAAGIAYRAVRNRGTIGGSLAHADPAADWVSALTAIDAHLVIHGPGGERQTPVLGFIIGAFTTTLAADEVITAVLVPKLSTQAAWGYYKICRRAGEFADAIGAVVLDPARRFARIVVGAMDGPPLLLDGLAATVAAEGVAAVSIDAVETALDQHAPGLDRVARRQYAVSVRRAVLQAFAA
jgi:carbon-monoxide dehydrogenase medium subunit